MRDGRWPVCFLKIENVFEINDNKDNHALDQRKFQLTSWYSAIEHSTIVSTYATTSRFPGVNIPQKQISDQDIWRESERHDFSK
jgi:hypothetical protein